jgi:mannosyltransferase
MNPHVSVIISAYNAAGTLKDCLQTMQSQTVPVEIIVVDDGSTDSTTEITQSFSSVQLIKQKHQGPAAARNLGATKAKGEILVFVDADMKFAPDFIEKLIKPINDNQTIGTFTKDEYVANWDSAWARCWNYEYTGTKTKKRIAPNSPNTSPVFRAINRQAFQSVGGFDQGGYDDDWSLSKKLKTSATVAPGANVWHANPDSAGHVFRQATWVSTRQYKLGLLGKLIALFRANPVFSILQGARKAITFGELTYVPFKIIFNAGISWGLLKQMPWLIIMVALIVRLPLLNGSYWLDEAAQALESARPLTQQLDIIPDFQPPLFHLLVHTLTYFNQSNWFLRLASLIPGLLTVWFTYKLGRLMLNQTVGLWAALLLATSPFHVFYSQELRPYSLATFIATVSMYWLLKHIRFHVPLWPLIIINALGLYTMYLYPFFILAQLSFVLLYHRQHLKPFLYATIPSVLLFLPWLPTFLKQLATGTGWLTSTPGWGSVVSPPLIKMLPLTLIKLVYGRLIIDPVPKDMLLLALWLLPLLVMLRSYKRWFNHAWLLVWIVVPLCTAFIVSLKIPVLDPKRVLYILPAFYLLIAVAFTRVRYGLWLLFFLVILNSINLGQYWTQPANQREPWQEAIARIEAAAHTGDTLVVFAFPEPFAPWQWYANPAIPTISIVPQNESESSLHAKLSLFTGYSTIITFDYLMDLTDPARTLNAWLKNHGYTETNALDYGSIGFIRIFQRPESFAALLR